MSLTRLPIFPLLVAASLGGCSFFTGETKKTPPPMEFGIESPYPAPRTFAIAPAINLSGSRDFDPIVVSDILYSEMQQVPGLNVLPVNKTLIAMNHLHMHSIEDVKSAQMLAAELGADGLVVPAITAYDPYNPPIVGMVLQIYTPEVHVPEASAKKPPAVLTNPDKPVVVAADVTPEDPNRQPAAQVNAVFNSTNQTVLKELAIFARGRTQYDSALLDQKFLADADSYMRFVCHAMIRRLMGVERERLVERESLSDR